MNAIRRLQSPTFLPLEDALKLSVGTPIDGIENLNVLDVKSRTHGSGDLGPFSRQAIKVEADGVSGKTQTWLVVWNFPDLAFLKGNSIHIESTANEDGQPLGLMVENDTRGAAQLKLSQQGLIDNQSENSAPEGQAHNLAAHQIVPGAVKRPAREVAAQQRAEAVQTPQQAQEGPPKRKWTPIFGATTGMALKLAADIIVQTRGKKTFEAYFSTPEFFKDLHFMAGNLIRVDTMLQNGDLEQNAKKKTEAGLPTDPEKKATKTQAAKSKEGTDKP